MTLTLQGLSQRYCIGDKDVGFVRVTAELRYQNVSKRAVLFLRRFHDVDSVKLRTEHPGQSEKPEHIVSFSAITETLDPDLRFGVRNFAHLAPGETYLETKSFSFPFHRSGRPLAGDLVGDGGHWVSAHVSVWPGTAQQARMLQRAMGDTPIVVQSLWSKAQSIQIDSSVPSQACGPE